MTTDNEHAARLLAAIAGGDERAMAEFYAAFGRQVYAFALRQVRDPQEAEDVVVETLYEVWRGARTFAGQSQVRTWVFSIARHKLLDRLRKRPPGQRVELDDVVETLADDEAPALERLAAARDAAQLAGCMERLSPEHRECLHLVFFEELGLAEVAAIQGVPENTVKTRVFHAKRHLRRCLERRMGGRQDDD